MNFATTGSTPRPGARAASIGVRLGLFNGALVLAALAALGGAGLVAVDKVLVAGAERILLDEMLDVQNVLAERRLSTRELQELLVREAAEEHAYDVHYRVSRPDGEVLATSATPLWARIAFEPVEAGETQFRTLRLPGDEHRLRVGTRLISSPDGPLKLGVALHLEPEDVAMARLLRAGALAVPAAIVGAALLGAFMARRALAPVDAIERAARTIGAGPRGRRLPASGTKDELDRLAETLNAMLDRLERAALRNLAFAGDVAHEVRTPLAVVRARLEEALAAAPSAPLEQALAAVERLEGLVRSLLALARADEGTSGSGIGPAPFDLADVARDVVAFFAPAAEARGMSLTLGVAEPSPLVGDKVAMARAAANLVDNALAYAPARSAVEVTVFADRGAAVLQVADEGPPIDEELRPRLFDRFARGASAAAARPDGAGLGLALVRAVARGLGGEAEHEAPPSGGNLFRLRLPAGAAARS